MDVITSIRKQYGLDITPGNEESATAIRWLRTRLENACESISKDLYSEVTHFIMELVQNADDNTYPDGVTPSLILELKGRVLSIRCNEVGFSEANVRALCAVKASTKKDPSRYIGAKGIGFKSVFTVAETASIFSGPFAFILDRNQTLGMISPTWIDDRCAEEGWTTIDLALSADTSSQSLTSYLDSIQPSILLFLRKLHTIEIRKKVKMLRLEKTVLDNGITRLRRCLDSYAAVYSDYIVFEHTVQTYRDEPDRQGILTSDIVLAFPLTPSGEPLEAEQNVHAFLPIRSYGFQFIVQADFLTTTNREDILVTKEWNRTLCNAIPAAFLDAISRLVTRPTLTYTWIRFLRHRNYASIFKLAYSTIVVKLKNSPILFSRGKEVHRPTELLILTAEFQAESGEPLIPEKYLYGKHYLAAEYDIKQDSILLAEIGVAQMTISDFVKGLSFMQVDGTLHAQSDGWWHTTCLVLLTHFGAVLSDLRRLAIVPLANGSWATAAGTDLFFDSPLDDVPPDLNFKLVKRLDPRSHHFRLLQDIGVKDVDCADVAHKILTLHRSSFQPGMLSPAALPSHAQYLFRHRAALADFDFSEFRVVTRLNNVVYAWQAYMDHHSFMRPSLSSCLNNRHAPFLHLSYVQMQANRPEDFRSWESWLRNVLHVNVSPILDENGWCPAFRQFLLQGETTKLLLLLRQFSEDIMARLRAHQEACLMLQETEVMTTLGTKYPLHKTYIPRGDLATAEFEHLPRLPIADPESPSWNFLAELGVSFGVDSGHYLKELVRLSERPIGGPVPLAEDETFRHAKECYKQLEARFVSENLSESVLPTFQENALIYFPSETQGGTWLKATSGVFWDGPPSARANFVLKHTYKDLGIFFSQQLGLPNAPPDILLRELEFVGASYSTGFLDGCTHAHIHDIFKDMADALTDSEDTICGWLPELRRFPCIPVEAPPGVVQLRWLDNGLYLPDIGGEIAGLFKGVVPVVTEPPPGSTNTLSSLHQLFGYTPLNIVRSLEAVVQRTLSGGERRSLESLANKYRSRRLYLPYLLNSSVDTDAVHDFYHALTNVQVFTVQENSVTHKYTLGGVTRIHTRPVGIEKDKETLNILVGKQCPSAKRDLYVCKELCSAFAATSISAATLLTIMTLETSILDELYGPPKELELPDGLSSRNAFIFGLPTPNTETPTTPPNEWLSFTHRTPPSVPRSQSLRVGSQPSSPAHGLSPGYFPSPFGSIAPWSPMDPRLQTPEQRLAGIEGERLIYRFLHDRLPGFTWLNWSSELRTEMGFPPLEVPCVTDFFYQDDAGVFTRQFFGDWCWNVWKNRPPTYRIEVKATAGASDEPFHFSSQQMATAMIMAKNLSPAAVGTTPTDIYVLARVSYAVHPQMSPCIFWYLNPWPLLCDGRMVPASDITLQIPASVLGAVWS